MRATAHQSMVSLITIVDLLVILSFVLALSSIRDYRRRGGLRYPPGPRPLPIIGNLLDIPKESSWLAYAKFAKRYGGVFFLSSVPSKMSSAGDVLSFHVFGKVIIVLNTVKATRDLLDKRGEIYSDRPAVPIYDMSGPKLVLPVLN